MSEEQQNEEPHVGELPKLRCLGGRQVAAGVLADLARLGALPPEARRNLWDALGPTLPEPIPAAASSAIEAFRLRYEVVGEDLAVGLKACRYLVREAAKRNLAAPKLAEDLAVLDGGSGALAELLLPGYEVAKATIREVLVRRALLRHGKTLLDAEWRVDTMTVSNEVLGMRVPVAQLTLRYHELGQAQAVTLQVPASVLRKLHAMLGEILAGGGS
ncbi:MAG: hypothetical protein HY908_10845 [Myxococcales bacterium]|nr:hypothetical protein [Myxococcales bacterium]